MIKTFKNKATEKIWNQYYSKKFPVNIQKIALRKLIHIDSAICLNDLKIPPGNKLHTLIGKRKGQHSIRINDQFRICFIWKDGNAYDVEIVDYH